MKTTTSAAMTAKEIRERSPKWLAYLFNSDRAMHARKVRELQERKQ